MKATGIVRRIDDLGRVVIPKEIRRTMRIREGDPLEIFTDKDGEVIFKKYSPIGELSEFASQYAETLYKTSGYPAIITDKDTIIAVSGAAKKELHEKRLSEDMEKVLEEKTAFIYKSDTDKKLSVTDSSSFSVGVAVPIIAEGDTVGSVVLLKDDENKKLGDAEEKISKAAALFLAKQMEL
ncbi:MAG: stage V sporulation protein T [Ruminococcaceae bacterium]|nr:stage V sporulation protein T [Oscillospiraceae bacterium]